jgi:hypothetical protein
MWRSASASLTELRAGNLVFARHALQDAENVSNRNEERLQQLDAEHSHAFGPLVDELSKSIHAAESECG